MNSYAWILAVIMIFVVLTPCFSTNYAIPFVVKIYEKFPPVITDFGSNVSIISSSGEEVLMHGFWSDISGMDEYNFSWNSTGVYENTTYSFGGTDWSNVTRSITNPSLEGDSIGFQFHAVDSLGIQNSSPLSYLSVLSDKPDYSLQSQSNDSVTDGDLIDLSVFWEDNFRMNNAFLQFNDTGDWYDNGSLSINSKSGWSVFSFNTSGWGGETLYWRIRATDFIGNENASGIMSFDVVNGS